MAQTRGIQEMIIQEVSQDQEHTNTLEMALKKIYATQEAFPETTHALLEDMILKKMMTINTKTDLEIKEMDKIQAGITDIKMRITDLDNLTMNEEYILDTEAQ